jgi:putative exosortase-associated protein (TIGR04073 family)
MKMNEMCLFLVVLFLGVSVFATEDPKNLGQYNDYVYDQQVTNASKNTEGFFDGISNGPIRKLGRGFSNTIFGVVEIPLRVYQTNIDQGGFAAWSFGLMKGITYFLGRELLGVFEIVTFPAPMPGCSTEKYKPGWGYGPIMQPEWILTFESNPFDFVYPDYPVK